MKVRYIMTRTVEEMNSLLIEIKENMKKFLLDNFNLTLDIPVRINGRLSKTGGQFVYYNKNLYGQKQAIKITIAKHALMDYPISSIIDIAYHECIHYALFTQDLPFRDKDQYFIDTCNKLGVSLHDSTPEHKYHVYTCGKGCYIKRHRRLNNFYYGLYACKIHKEDIDYFDRLSKEEIIHLEKNFRPS